MVIMLPNYHGIHESYGLFCWDYRTPRCRSSLAHPEYHWVGFRSPLVLDEAYNSSNAAGWTHHWISEMSSSNPMLGIDELDFCVKKATFRCGWKTAWWFGCHFFLHLLGISSSQLTNSYFSEGWPNHQPEKCCKHRKMWIPCATNDGFYHHLKVKTTSWNVARLVTWLYPMV